MFWYGGKLGSKFKNVKNDSARKQGGVSKYMYILSGSYARQQGDERRQRESRMNCPKEKHAL